MTRTPIRHHIRLFVGLQSSAGRTLGESEFEDWLFETKKLGPQAGEITAAETAQWELTRPTMVGLCRASCNGIVFLNYGLSATN